MSMTEMPDCIGLTASSSKVGEGGMGVVYKAEDSRLGRVVALKIIRECDADFSRRRRFWQEARAAAQVAHPQRLPHLDVQKSRDRWSW